MNRNYDSQQAWSPVSAIVFAGALLFWLHFEYLKAINPDIFWLTTGAGQLLHGARMVDAIYDPNPPLSIIVYIPVYLLSRGGVSEEGVVILTTMIYALISSAAVYALARRIIGQESAAIVTVSFFLAGTVMCTAEFGQRDQMVAFSLLPFVLGQIILTRRIACPRMLLNIVFFSGGILLLLKPHFGLVPAIFLIHRGIVQKKWSFLQDPDFIFPALISVLYISVIWIFFHDYATVIFPDVIKLYLSAAHSMIVVVYSILLLFVYLLVLSLSRFIERRMNIQAPLIQVLIACALLCLVPYLVQMKDFKYHLLPSLTFFWTALGLFIFTVARRKMATGISAALMIVILSAAGYAAEPPSSYMTRIQAESLPLTRLVAQCGAHCKFMMLDEVVRTMFITQRYAGKENTSRFPSLWFLPKLVSMPDGSERERLFRKYARFLAEDLSKGRPDLLISCNDEFDFVGFFSHNDDFAQAMKSYNMDGKITIDYGAYYPEAPPGVLKKYACQIYRRGIAGR